MMLRKLPYTGILKSIRRAISEYMRKDRTAHINVVDLTLEQVL